MAAVGLEKPTEVGWGNLSPEHSERGLRKDTIDDQLQWPGVVREVDVKRLEAADNHSKEHEAAGREVQQG